MTRRLTSFLLLLGALVLPYSASSAQTPRTIRIVVPFPGGGPTDVTARVVSEQIGKLHGISFVIENRLGGGGLIAIEAVARAEPDGGTLLIVAGGMLIGSPQEVAEKVAGLEAIGVDTLLLVCSFGNLAHPQVCRSLELFAEAAIKPRSSLAPERRIRR